MATYGNIMKKLTLIFLAFAGIVPAHAQSKYWVKFTDKNGTPYTVGNPSAFLSNRAIQRRNVQGIPVIQNDLPCTPAYITGVASTGATVINRSKWFNAVTVSATSAQLSAIQALPYVQTTMQVEQARWNGDLEEGFNSGGRKSVQLQSTVYNYGPSFNQANMIGVPCLHQQGYSGQGMVIAILDAGFYNVNVLPAFDSLWANSQILGTKDFVLPGNNVFNEHWHGMMVLSTMGGYWPDSIVGTAPKAKYWLLRSEQAATEYVIEEDNWVSAAEFADSAGADIINTSLGYTTFDNSSMNHTYADMDGNTTHISIGADLAVSKGIFVCVSAGNSGASPWHYIGAPADADSVLTVGAVDPSGIITSFSSRGPSFDGRIKPTTVAQGGNAIVSNTSGGIQQANGTSFSSPITAGAVACLWQTNPNKKVMDVYQSIIMSASKYSAPDDSVYGYGIPNFCSAVTILSDDKVTSEKNAFTVYPNPANEAVNVNVSVSGEMVVCNYLGEEMLREKIGKGVTRLQLAGRPAGLYLLQFISEKGISYGKIIKE